VDKQTLRKQYLDQRLALSELEWQEKSRQISKNLKIWLQFRDYTHFILFRSFRREPMLNNLAAELGPERCFYPRLQAMSMCMLPAPADGQFERNRWGLEEPFDRGLSAFKPDAKTLILVPAVAIDEDGYRLGYGAGFFDRYLQENQGATLGLCFDEFLLPRLPREPHDIPLQAVITDRRTLELTPKFE
jgi:5-formyltetrahydrofolate cyclo-ligase